MNKHLQVVAAIHMLDTRERGETDWTCTCPACAYTRSNMHLAEAMWQHTGDQPKKPDAKPTNIQFIDVPWEP